MSGINETSYTVQREIKERNRSKILSILLKKPSSFTELLKETKLSPTGLTNHLHELEEEKQIELSISGRKRVYQLTEKVPIEDLIVESLTEYLGQFTASTLLHACERGEKEVRIEEFYKPSKFIEEFVKKRFNVTKVDCQKLLEAFLKKYGEPTI